ncbi:hypothetical protein NLG97_g3006 [Lecanicillium saksenae]|uniref:Uncharacterized protein n=1 Tax=Lecanicillium saksenae TaxID=468837 RepID=A0ACC1R134_9HYPO|nr:hypothetical protein NLG97_g3006 [Lecanicillium saksenae]
MKVALPVIVLFAATASASDLGKLASDLTPYIKKAKCASPCVTKIADRLGCEGGTLTTLCNNVDKIKNEAEDCLSKCGIDKNVRETFAMIIKDIFPKNSQ